MTTWVGVPRLPNTSYDFHCEVCGVAMTARYNASIARDEYVHGHAEVPLHTDTGLANDQFLAMYYDWLARIHEYERDPAGYLQQAMEEA